VGEKKSGEVIGVWAPIFLFQYCVTGTEFVTLGNGIRYTN
jgi:hypothetical protein